MPCDSRLAPQQTISERKREILDSVTELNSLLVSGKVKVLIGPQGAVVFQNWSEPQRRRITDACAYRRLLAIGSSLAKAKIAQAETLGGRKVSVQAVGAGVHSHDNGRTFHDHKG